MYWSRKFKTNSCKTCDYIGIARNDPRHALKYTCPDGSQRPSRVLDPKKEVLANKLLNVDTNKQCCNGTRSLQHIYRGGNQPNSNERNYSYSYNDLLRLRRYKNNLPSSSNWKVDGTSSTYGVGGTCKNTDGTCNKKYPKVIWKPNNVEYGVQGAVSSSSRIDRLKLKTIQAEKQCSNGKCNGVYFAGRHRNVGKIYNVANPEKGCPQNSARARARGQYSRNCN